MKGDVEMLRNYSFNRTKQPAQWFRIALVVASLMMVVGCASSQAGEPKIVDWEKAFDPVWSQQSIWDDGKAEVAIYDASRVIYGKARPHEEIRIIVAEPMDKEAWVKADPPYEGRNILNVLKYNIVARVPTKNYDYQFMASLFLDRGQPARVVKGTYSSQEWCGQTFKDLQLYKSPPRFTANSYWDGQAIVDQPLDLPANTLLEDQLPVTLRACNLDIDEAVDIHLIPSLISSKAPVPQPLKARLTRLHPSESLIAGGLGYMPEKQMVFKVEAAGDYWVVYQFDLKPPHHLLCYKTSDGRTAKLKLGVKRRAYWAD